MATAREVVTQVNQIAKFWDARKPAFKKWYNLIRLFNDLYQDKMESVISSDPRTGFNMAKWLLTPKSSSFNVVTDDMNEAEIAAVGSIGSYSEKQFRTLDRRTRSSLYGSFTQRVLSYMLATGWYSVISYPTDKGWIFNVWNPASCFPEYDAEGHLSRFARQYNVPYREGMRLAAHEGWAKPSQQGAREINVSLLWTQIDPLTVGLQVVMGNQLVLEAITPFERIPIYCKPVAGLPDDGTIMNGDAWKAEIGESVVAPIADVSKNFDKMMTYMQQLIRDTANPRWIEEVNDSVLSPDRLFERGAIFTIQPGERIYPIPTPPLPPEMRSHEFDLRGQMQRGLFSDITFGDVQGQVSAFMMSNVTAASQQILSPFFDGIKGLYGDIATNNISMMREYGMSMDGIPFPNLNADLDVSFDYDITIPGDFLQRANSAKVINPEFRLSMETLTDILFPEVRSALIERGRLANEDSWNNELFKQAMLIQTLRKGVTEAEQIGDESFADALSKMLSVAEGQAGGQQPQQEGRPNMPQGFGGGATSMPPDILSLMARS